MKHYLSLLFFLLIIFPSLVISATLNVGTGQTYATIQLATNAAVAGDTVFVHNLGSPYVGFSLLSPHVSGTATNPITIQAESSSVVINSPTGTGDNINIDSVNYVVVDGFEVASATRNGIRVVLCTGCIVKNVFVHDSGQNGVLTGFAVNFQLFGSHITANGSNSGNHNVYISNSDTGYNGIHVYSNEIDHVNFGNNMQLNGDCTSVDPLGVSTGEVNGFFIERNKIHDGPQHGIQVIDASGGLVRNNLIYGNSGAQIQTGSQSGCVNVGSNNDTYVNNTFDSPSSESIRIVQPSTGTIWYNNISVTTNTRDCVDDNSGGLCTTGVDGVTFYSPGTFITPSTAGGGTYFVNYAGHNYVLISGSPAIDAGLSTGGVGHPSPVYDYLFNSRPVGGGWDTGAYEFNGVPVTPDTTPPTTPGTPAITNGAYQVQLISWTPSTDNLELLWYIIYRNGLPHGVSYSTTFTDANVLPATSYTYTIYALDTSWNISTISGGSTVTTFGIAGCMNADHTFRSVFTQNQTGAFEFTADLTPFTNTTNSVTSLSAIAPTSYDDEAVQILFSPSGFVQARNGGTYQADNVYSYTTGTAYHVRVDVDIVSHTYSVFISTGGPETTIGSNYAFRSTQGSATHLEFLGITEDPSANGSASVCNPAINGIPTSGLIFIPVTSQSLATQLTTTILVDANGTGNPVLTLPKMPTLVSSRDLNPSDAGGLLEYTGSSPITVNIPVGLVVGFPVTIVQGGTGVINFTGAYVSRINATRTIGQDSPAVIQCTVTHCYLWGDVQ